MREFPTINLDVVLTPWENAVCVEIGPISAKSLTDLRSRLFDQAPVFANGVPIGLVPVTRLEALAAAGEPLNQDDSAIVTTSVAPSANLGDAMKAVEEFGMASVGLGDARSGGGFYTVSDLNKHAVRSLIYPLFAELESRLARMAEKYFDDPWVWLEKLDKEKQARLVGYWELGKRANVDVGPLAGTTLSELSAIIGKAEMLRQSLGFRANGKWNEFFGGLVDLRNSVMHPVRPIFTSVAIVKAVREALTRILNLLDRLDDLKQSEQARTPAMGEPQ